MNYLLVLKILFAQSAVVIKNHTILNLELADLVVGLCILSLATNNNWFENRQKINHGDKTWNNLQKSQWIRQKCYNLYTVNTVFRD